MVVHREYRRRWITTFEVIVKTNHVFERPDCGPELLHQRNSPHCVSSGRINVATKHVAGACLATRIRSVNPSEAHVATRQEFVDRFDGLSVRAHVMIEHRCARVVEPVSCTFRCATLNCHRGDNVFSFMLPHTACGDATNASVEDDGWQHVVSVEHAWIEAHDCIFWRSLILEPLFKSGFLKRWERARLRTIRPLRCVAGPRGRRT